MKMASIALAITLGLSACSPMLISIYRPSGVLPTTEKSMCGWPSIRVQVLDADDVKIDLAFSPSDGIGTHQLFVKVAAGTTMAFREQRIRVESMELGDPFFGDPFFTRFGTYYRGAWGTIGPLEGPIAKSFFVQHIEAIRPREIKVSLPDIEVNGRIVRPQAVSFTLSHKPAIVGFCQ
jgi:hypothetical protein